MVNTFTTIVSADSIRIDKDEIDEGRFWTFAEIDENIGKNIFTPNFESEYKRLKQIWA